MPFKVYLETEQKSVSAVPCGIKNMKHYISIGINFLKIAPFLTYTEHIPSPLLNLQSRTS